MRGRIPLHVLGGVVESTKQIHIIIRALEGETIGLDQDAVVIGRGPENDTQIKGRRMLLILIREKGSLKP